MLRKAASLLLNTNNVDALLFMEPMQNEYRFQFKCIISFTEALKVSRLVRVISEKWRW